MKGSKNKRIQFALFSLFTGLILMLMDKATNDNSYVIGKHGRRHEEGTFSYLFYEGMNELWVYIFIATGIILLSFELCKYLANKWKNRP